jgi:uncharacterized Zn finger protein
MLLKFYVQGSAPEPYFVQINKDGNNLGASCDCPAGQNGQYCKHRVNLLKGLRDGVVGGDLDQISALPSIIKGTDVELAMQELVAALDEEERAKKRTSSKKKAFAKAMLR